MVVYMDDRVFVAVASGSLARVWVQGSPMASATPFLGYTRWTDGDNDDTGDPTGRQLDRKLRRWITRSATEEVGCSCLFDMLEVKQKGKKCSKDGASVSSWSSWSYLDGIGVVVWAQFSPKGEG